MNTQQNVADTVWTSNLIDTIDDTIGLIDLCLLALKNKDIDFGYAKDGFRQTLTLANENLALVNLQLAANEMLNLHSNINTQKEQNK